MTTPSAPSPAPLPVPQRFGLRSQTLGCLPVVNFFLDRLGLAEHLGRRLRPDARLRVAPAAVVQLVVANIVAAGHRPVYALGEWAAGFDPVVLGLGPGDATACVSALNDDRVGRMPAGCSTPTGPA